MTEPTTFSPAMERFFEELEECGPFTLVGLAIRQRAFLSIVCPVCAVANNAVGTQAFTGAWNNRRVMQLTGLSHDESADVAAAADHSACHNPALRARLLECCGLAEVGQ